MTEGRFRPVAVHTVGSYFIFKYRIPQSQKLYRVGACLVGQIEKIERHPDADKLIVCQVNVGNGTIQIVTGASNVKEGDKVPRAVQKAF